MAEHLQTEPLTMTIAEYSKIHKVNQRYLRRIVTANKKQLLNESHGILSYKILGKTYILTVNRANPGGIKNSTTSILPTKKPTDKNVSVLKSSNKVVSHKKKNYMIRFESREISQTYMKFFPVKIRKSESVEQFLLTENPTKSEWELYRIIIELLRKKKINIEIREW